MRLSNAKIHVSCCGAAVEFLGVAYAIAHDNFAHFPLQIGSIKSAAAIVHADSVGTEPTTVTTADSQPADTGIDHYNSKTLS